MAAINSRASSLTAEYLREQTPTPKPMSKAQRVALEELAHCGGSGFPGYSELMLQLDLTSYKAVDWVLDALIRRGYLQDDNDGGYEVTDSGRAALAKAAA